MANIKLKSLLIRLFLINSPMTYVNNITNMSLSVPNSIR